MYFTWILMSFYFCRRTSRDRILKILQLIFKMLFYCNLHCQNIIMSVYSPFWFWYQLKDFWCRLWYTRWRCFIMSGKLVVTSRKCKGKMFPLDGDTVSKTNLWDQTFLHGIVEGSSLRKKWPLFRNNMIFSKNVWNYRENTLSDIATSWF